MFKKNGVSKLGKPNDQRDALIKSQVKDIFAHGYIKTTNARAKAVARRVDMLMAFVEDKKLKEVKQYLLDDKLAAKVANSPVNGKRSGYTTSITIKNRPGDNAELVLLELVKLETEKVTAKKTKTKKK
jgi:large subunit ribosomal protein L17